MHQELYTTPYPEMGSKKLHEQLEGGAPCGGDVWGGESYEATPENPQASVETSFRKPCPVVKIMDLLNSDFYIYKQPKHDACCCKLRSSFPKQSGPKAKVHRRT